MHGDRFHITDIDPYRPGMEVRAFSGVYNAATNRLTHADTTFPALRRETALTSEVTARGSGSGFAARCDSER